MYRIQWKNKIVYQSAYEPYKSDITKTIVLSPSCSHANWLKCISFCFDSSYASIYRYTRNVHSVYLMFVYNSWQTALPTTSTRMYGRAMSVTISELNFVFVYLYIRTQFNFECTHTVKIIINDLLYYGCIIWFFAFWSKYKDWITFREMLSEAL